MWMFSEFFKATFCPKDIIFLKKIKDHFPTKLCEFLVNFSSSSGQNVWILWSFWKSHFRLQDMDFYGIFLKIITDKNMWIFKDFSKTIYRQKKLGYFYAIFIWEYFYAFSKDQPRTMWIFKGFSKAILWILTNSNFFGFFKKF